MTRKVAVQEDLMSELVAQTSFDEVWLNPFCLNVPHQKDLLFLAERHPKFFDISVSWIYDTLGDFHPLEFNKMLKKEDEFGRSDPPKRG